MATEQKQNKKSSSKQLKPGPILDTSGGEMPNPNAPSHGPSEEELTEVLKKSMTEKSSPPSSSADDNIRESQGDLADQAEREIENEIRNGIDRARGDLRH
jgi:hypothetical protein